MAVYLIVIIAIIKMSVQSDVAATAAAVVYVVVPADAAVVVFGVI